MSKNKGHGIVRMKISVFFYQNRSVNLLNNDREYCNFNANYEKIYVLELGNPSERHSIFNVWKLFNYNNSSMLGNNSIINQST